MKELLRKLLSLRMLILICILCAAFFRCMGIFTQAWLDEIWALISLQGAASAIDFFAKVAFDGHATLYSLVIYYCHSLGLGFEYMRIGALICAFLTLWLIWLFCQQTGKVSASACLALCSFSYILTLYGSEARGYSAMLCFGFLAFLYLEKALRSFCSVGQDTTIRAPFAPILIFGISSYLAFLFHASFVQFFAAMVAWQLFILLRAKTKGALYFLILCNLLPAASILCTYWLYLRHLPSGGGSIRPYMDVCIETLSAAFGGPLTSPSSPQYTLLALLWATTVLTLLVRAIVMLYRRGEARWFLYLIVIFVAPAILVFAMQPKSLSGRYFLFSIVFAYAAMAELFAHAVQQSKKERLFVLSLGLLCLCGMLCYQANFLRYGRGQYKEALEFIVQHSATQRVNLCGNHDFRNRMMLDYLASETNQKGKSFNYLGQAEDGCQWYLMQSQDFFQTPRSIIENTSKEKFELIASFYSAPFSGWNWFLYGAARDNSH